MARHRHSRAFTLTEMTVVIGIIIMVLLLAIPAIRTMTGSRSTDAAQNQLSAIIGQARMDAIGLQEYRGVFFYIDPATDRITAALVRAIPQSTQGTAHVYLDTTPNREFLVLPQGVGIQTITNPQPSPNNDRYLGFNPGPGSTRYGGVILFDLYGRLVSCTFGFELTNPGSGATDTQSGMGLLLGAPDPGNVNGQTWVPTAYLPSSQFGFVLYDREAFKNVGGTDGDMGLDTTDTNVTSTNESAEETWLDVNATPILINRYNGTLIKGE